MSGGYPLPDMLALELLHLYGKGIPIQLHYERQDDGTYRLVNFTEGGEMPYRINPKDHLEVQIFKGKKWKKLKRHTTAEKARKHLAALRINVDKRGE